MAREMLNEEQMAELSALIDEADAANPEPTEDEVEMEEAQDVDEVDQGNEAVDELGEGDGEAADAETEPDPNAAPAEAAAAAPAAPALPEGIENVEQLVQAYNELRTQADKRGEEMSALRDMNEQLVSIAQVLGYSKDIESVDLSVNEDDPSSQMRAMISEQFKPLIEQQQRNLRNKLIDQSWKTFSAEHDDMGDLMDDIRKVLKESPELSDDENGLAVAYHMARSGRYKSEKALFEDDKFVESAAKNEKVKEKVIAEYLKEIGNSNKRAPASVGKGGSSVPTPVKKRSSMKDAHKAASKLFE
jgi:hypothetical protein